MYRCARCRARLRVRLWRWRKRVRSSTCPRQWSRCLCRADLAGQRCCCCGGAATRRTPSLSGITVASAVATTSAGSELRKLS